MCDGRILKYDVPKKDLRTVASGLCFANGVQLSVDESLLLVSGTFKHRVRIIDVMTWKTLQFIDMPSMLYCVKLLYSTLDLNEKNREKSQTAANRIVDQYALNCLKNVL